MTDKKALEMLLVGTEATECEVKKDLYQTAISALEKQIPKKVIFESDGYSDGNPVYDLAECPKCGFPFEDGDQDWESSYCPNCGQRLDWECE